MKNRIVSIIVLISSVLTLSHCSKVTEFKSDSVSDYFPAQVGRSTIYRVDSSIYVGFGQALEEHTSVIKDTIENEFTDNMGRPSFRVRRFIRDADDTTIWNDMSTYVITKLPQSVEVNEDNLRFIKLQMPIKEFFSWNGNRYLPEDPFFPKFEFGSSDHRDMGSWDYYYDSVDGTEALEGVNYPNTITIKGADANSNNIPANDLDVTGSKTFWMEKYAKGVGLIYKEVSLEEFQARNSIYPNGYYTGFQMRQTLISHN